MVDVVPTILRYADKILLPPLYQHHSISIWSTTELFIKAIYIGKGVKYKYCSNGNNIGAYWTELQCVIFGLLTLWDTVMSSARTKPSTTVVFNFLLLSNDLFRLSTVRNITSLARCPIDQGLHHKQWSLSQTGFRACMNNYIQWWCYFI